MFVTCCDIIFVARSFSIMVQETLPDPGARDGRRNAGNFEDKFIIRSVPAKQNLRKFNEVENLLRFCASKLKFQQRGIE